MTEHIHAYHADIAKRLKRANGHLKSIIEMIETERSCVDIAQQLYAVEKALVQAKKTLIQDHIDHCHLHRFVRRLSRATRPLLKRCFCYIVKRYEKATRQYFNVYNDCLRGNMRLWP